MNRAAFKLVSEERVNFNEKIFETLTFANPPQTVTVEAANLRIHLKCENLRQVHLIKERYKDFLTEESEAGKKRRQSLRFLEAGVWVKERPYFITPPSAPEEFVIEVAHENNRISVLSYSFAGYLDVKSLSGKLVIIKEADEIRRNPEGFWRNGYLGSIENYLRVVYSWLCIEGNGFLLHACGIIRSGFAYIFFGPSESGKTTVAMLSRKWPILSDDLVIVRRINGQTRAFGVPFRGEAPFPFVSKNENAPIAGFFELQKSPSFRLEKLSRPLAVAKLVSNIPFLGGKLMLSGKPLAVCNDVVADVPCYTMYFTKEDYFWQELI